MTQATQPNKTTFNGGLFVEGLFGFLSLFRSYITCRCIVVSLASSSHVVLSLYVACVVSIVKNNDTTKTIKNDINEI